MLPAFRYSVAAVALLPLTEILLSSCSSPSPATTATTPAVAVTIQPSTRFPFGGKVDSLNGLAGHTFGQPLSAFPRMRAMPVSPGELTRA